MSVETTVSPFVLTSAAVEAVERVSPTFVRITFGAEALPTSARRVACSTSASS